MLKNRYGGWSLGYNDFDTFEKMEKARVKMGAKTNFKSNSLKGQ